MDLCISHQSSSTITPLGDVRDENDRTGQRKINSERMIRKAKKKKPISKLRNVEYHVEGKNMLDCYREKRNVY